MLWALNPPKITLWMAPILAQAKTAIANSGIIPIYMQTLSPFLTPLFFKTCEKAQTFSYNCLYVKTLWCSSGSLPSHIMAGSLAFVSRCLSIQFSVILSLPPLNHSTTGREKFQLRPVSHFFFQRKLLAISVQKCSGFSILFL